MEPRCYKCENFDTKDGLTGFCQTQADYLLQMIGATGGPIPRHGTQHCDLFEPDAIAIGEESDAQEEDRDRDRQEAIYARDFNKWYDNLPVGG